MEDDTSVRVAVRIRPQISRELIDMCRLCTSVTPGEPQVVLGNDKAFTFDYVFDRNSVQMLIYETCVQQLVEGCFEGYNATVLAYGQTGSGKTYTMGTGFDVNVATDELGIIPRAVEHLFEGIEERRQRAYINNEPLPEFKIHVQFMELYNEDIIDLFDSSREAKGKRSLIKIHEEANGGIYAVGMTTRVVTSKQETLQCLKVGALSRTTASTNMNVSSSRSHAIFTLHIKQQRIGRSKDPDMEVDTIADNENGVDEFETVTAKFHFVDLAGSERLKRTGATGDRAKEGISINCGLLALGNVISALGDVTKRGSHIPYRDSKLTRLLQDSLGGNSRTLMIACVSPSDSDFMETLNTLKYANRTRNIKNKVIRNQDKNSKTIQILRNEIQQLQLELLEYKQGKRVLVNGEESINDMFHENTMLQTENNNLRVRIKALQETTEAVTTKNSQLLSERAAGEWISSGGDTSDISGIIQGYIKEVETLRTKLLEAEYTCQTLRRNVSRTQTRLSMSPLHSHAVAISGIYDIGCDAEMDSVDDVLVEAKKDLEKLREKERAKKRSTKHASDKDVEENLYFDNNDVESGDHATEEPNDENGEDDPEYGGSGSNNNSSDTDTDTDENEQYRSDLATLTCEISIKQKLIEQLEHSQKRLQTMRHHYEEKLIQLTNKMRETQEERDRVLANIGSMENNSGERAKKVKEEYERKLNDMMNEVKKIQAAKKEHARVLKNQGQYEKQVKTLRAEVDDMKRAKVRLMNKIKEEASRHKETEQRHNREIAQLKKESRKRQNQIRTLEAEKKLKEVVLRRKQEEVSALRKVFKPMSDRVAGRVTGRTRQQEIILQQQQQQHNPSNSHMNSSPKVAKSKWQHLEKKITKLVLNKSAITSLEADMERHLRDREMLIRNLEKCMKKSDIAVIEGKGQRMQSDLDDEIESLRANIDYIQQSIAESQATIIQIEESKEGPDLLDVDSMVSSMNVSEETKYLMSKLLNMTISQSVTATVSETNCKEAAAKIQKLEQDNETQRQLIALLLPNSAMSDYLISAENIESWLSSDAGSVPSSRSISPIDATMTAGNAPTLSSSTDSIKRNKARRRTAANPEALLFEDGLLGPDASTMLSVVEEPPPSSNVIAMKTSTSNTRIAQSSSLRPVVTKVTANPTSFLRKPGISSTTHNTTTSSYTNNETVMLVVPSDPTPPTSPIFSRKLGREGNVFSRLTGGTTSDDTSRPNSGVIRTYDGIAKPALKSSLPSPLNCIQVAEGHSRSVLDVVATDELMFSASTDRTVKVWDLIRGCEITSLGDHPNSVVVVRYCERTRQVFTASSAYVKAWDLRESNTRCIKTFHSSGLTANGSVTGTTLRVPPGENQVNDVAVDSYGTSLFTAAGSLVRMWDLRNYCSVGKLSGSHQAAVTCLAVEDVDGQKTCVVTGSKDHYVKLFEIATFSSGVHQPKIDLEPPHYDGIQALALRGNVLFSGSRDMCIKKWDLKKYKLKQSLNQAHKDWVCGLCFVNAGGQQPSLLSCCRGGYVRQWCVDTCQLVGEIRAHNSSINAIVVNANCVFTASNDTTVRIWRPRNVNDLSPETIETTSI